jgi:GNAT superfamily N-acetyltransferase
MTETTTTLRSDQSLADLLTEANQSPFIGEIPLAELHALIAAGTIIFLYEDETLVGFSGWTPINTTWDEIGPLFVSERFQGRGFGKHLLLAVVAECKQHGKNLYVVTSNPKVKNILAKDGFEPRTMRQLPFSVQLFILRKLSPRKILRFMQKRHPEPITHLVHAATPT